MIYAGGTTLTCLRSMLASFNFGGSLVGAAVVVSCLIPSIATQCFLSILAPRVYNFFHAQIS